MNESAKICQVRRVTVAGMAVNVCLAAAKAAAGWACSSHALVADAVHSLSDLVTDIAVALGVRFWVAPADDAHPYGHGKIEALVTLFISLALAFVACELGWAAAVRLMAKRVASRPGLAACAVAVASVVLKELIFRWTRRVARRVKSPALEANAWHHRSDELSSAPVAVAVAASWLMPSLAWADSAGALLVAAFILHVSWQLAKPALQELVDADIDDKAAAVVSVAEKVPGVHGVHKARARRYGGSFQVDLHVQVDPSLSVAEGHDIGHAVKEAVCGAGLDVNDAVVHVEPDAAVRFAQAPSGTCAGHG